MELRPLGGTLRIVAPNTNTHAKNKVTLCKKVSHKGKETARAIH